MTTSGVFHEYPVTGASDGGIIGSSLKGITVGSDGNIWFTNWGSGGSSTNFVGVLNPNTGDISGEYLLSPDGSPQGIVSGPDGNLWVAAYGSVYDGEDRSRGKRSTAACHHERSRW
jgi:streptogramin lyase